MLKRQSLQAVIFIAGLCLSSHASAETADKCLAKPSGPPPNGQHWYYHRVEKHTCWYLRAEGLPVHRHAHQKKSPSAEKARAQAAPAASEEKARTQAAPAATAAKAHAQPPAPEKKASVHTAPAPLPQQAQAANAQSSSTDTASHAPVNNKPPAEATQTPWPDATASQRKPDFAWPDPPATPPVAQSASAGATTPLPSTGVTMPAPHAGADQMGNPPTTDQSRTADATDPPPPAQQPVAAAPPRRPSPKTAALGKTAEDDFAFTLFILLFAGLVVGGLLYAVVRRRNRLHLEDDDRQPIWTRIMSGNAPAPRIRGREHDAWTQALEEQFAAPPLAPDDHSEQLARALQALADRLRARPGAAAPGPASSEVRRRRVRNDTGPVPPPRWLADSYATDEARRHSHGDPSTW